MDLMAPKLLAETAGMIGLKELKDAFREVRKVPFSFNFKKKIQIKSTALNAFVCSLIWMVTALSPSKN